jgi:hypothetical protein
MLVTPEAGEHYCSADNGCRYAQRGRHTPVDKQEPPVLDVYAKSGHKTVRMGHRDRPGTRWHTTQS